MGNPNKDSDSGTMEAGAEFSGKGVGSARKAHQAARDLSCEREARDATLAN